MPIEMERRWRWMFEQKVDADVGGLSWDGAQRVTNAAGIAGWLQ